MEASTLKKAEEKMSDCTNQAADLASKAFDKGRESVASLRHGAGEMATAVAQAATQAAGNLAAAAGNKVDQAAGYAGRGIESLADSIRRHTPDDGMVGAASDKVAASLASGGSYLKEQGVTGMAGDMTNLIRRNPISAVCVALGIGFAIGRVVTKNGMNESN